MLRNKRIKYVRLTKIICLTLRKAQMKLHLKDFCRLIFFGQCSAHRTLFHWSPCISTFLSLNFAGGKLPKTSKHDLLSRNIKKTSCSIILHHLQMKYYFENVWTSNSSPLRTTPTLVMLWWDYNSPRNLAAGSVK